MTDATTSNLTDALASLEFATDLPADDRNAKRARKLKVELAMLDLDKAAVAYRAALDQANADNKANVTKRVAQAKSEARAAMK